MQLRSCPAFVCPVASMTVDGSDCMIEWSRVRGTPRLGTPPLMGQAEPCHGPKPRPPSRRCCAVLCCAVLCCAVLCCAVLCCAVLCCAVLCCAMLCHAMPCYAMLCYAMMCHDMSCCAVPVLCCAVLCCCLHVVLMLPLRLQAACVICA